jgi:membrane fusion protein (multidrug efflux system)
MKGESTGFTPRIRLANDQIYPHDGKLDFIDNRVDPSTGTIKVRVEFPNPDALILPGQFVNVTLVSADPQQQMVVPQAAVQTNQTGPFVLVVNKDNKVELRPIQTGQRVGTRIAVTEGLNVGETIIVEGIQKVRPGATVKPVAQQKRAAAK